jgi:pimeloyl-ACP methyl ester carboxylesterase
MAKSPLAQLITVTATDGLMLPALFFQPKGGSQRLIIWLHGMGSSGIFYSTAHTNALAAAFTGSGTAFLGLQNRGGGMLQGVRYLDEAGEKQKRIQGTSHELIAECVHDIDGAITYAKDHGYTEIYLGGHSTGANKTALYSFLKPENDISGYILYGGGDDTGLYYEELGETNFNQALIVAKKQVEAGQGADLAPDTLIGEHFSYQSIADILDPDGGYNTFPFYEAQSGRRLGTKPLFQEYKSITKPTLVVYGAEDEYCRPDVPAILAILKRECPAPDKFTFQTIPGGDHGCYTHEPELAETIAAWIESRRHA